METDIKYKDNAHYSTDITIGYNLTEINKLIKKGYKIIKKNNRVYAIKELKW